MIKGVGLECIRRIDGPLSPTFCRSVINTCHQPETQEELAETGLLGPYEDSDEDLFDDAKESYSDS